MVSRLKTKYTLTQIAKKAGVSQPMVSNILNGKGRSSAEVRAKVLALLDEAGYRPLISRNPFFHVVAASRKPDCIAPHISSLQFGMQIGFADEGLIVQQQYAHLGFGLSPTKQAELIAGQNPSGVIIDSEKEWSKPFLDQFHKSKLPVVQVGQHCSDQRFPSVSIDCLGGVRAAVNKLIQRGHSKIAFIRWFPSGNAANSTDKFIGYKSALEENGIEYDAGLVAEVGQMPPIQKRWDTAARYALKQIIDAHPGITAAVIDNSYIAPSVILPMGEDGGRLPDWLDQLEIALFADQNIYGQGIFISRQLCVPIKSLYLIAPDWIEVGKLAAQEAITLARENNKDAKGHCIRILPKLNLPDVIFE